MAVHVFKIIWIPKQACLKEGGPVWSDYTLPFHLHLLDAILLGKTSLFKVLEFKQFFLCPRIWAASWQNQQNGICAQRSLRSAWASAQSDQVFAVRMKKAQVLNYPLSAQWRLIRLGGCQGWSESSLGTQMILLVLSRGGSFYGNHCITSTITMMKKTEEESRSGVVFSICPDTPIRATFTITAMKPITPRQCWKERHI